MSPGRDGLFVWEGNALGPKLDLQRGLNFGTRKVVPLGSIQ